MEAEKMATRPMLTEVRKESLAADLESYRRKALELGASAAEIIPSSYVLVDERVWMRCLVPRCPRAGETPNCPPNAPRPEFVRKALSKYSWAILFEVSVEPIVDYVPRRGGDTEKERKTLSYHKQIGEIVYQIERMAYADGYYLAMGFGGGSCKDYLCGGVICQFLDSGRCRFPLRARPAMEAVGIDVFDVIKKVGWGAYPLMDELDLIPHAISVGIVFIH
jgi:predicted metal-binding protein